ncbi:MAG: M23 family metallopeptidase, partial [Candidatus Sericytochromatia bacterium]
MTPPRLPSSRLDRSATPTVALCDACGYPLPQLPGDPPTCLYCGSAIALDSLAEPPAFAELLPPGLRGLTADAPVRPARRRKRLSAPALLGATLLLPVLGAGSYVGALALVAPLAPPVETRPAPVTKVDIRSLLPTAAEERQAVAPLPTPRPPTARPRPAALAPPRKEGLFVYVSPTDPRLGRLALPIDGLDGPPRSRELYPGAARTYRNGWHEGLDFYPEGRWNAVIRWGTPVRAVADGRLDMQTSFTFSEMLQEEHAHVLAASHNVGFTPMDVLLKLRGRSVWLNHGKGFKTVYAHLSALGPGLEPGAWVKQGQIIGYVGNSGTTNGVQGTRQDFHLHFEMWLDGRIVGANWSESDYATLWPFPDGAPATDAGFDTRLLGR